MDYIERALNTAYSGGIEALVDAERTESGNIRGRFIGTEGNVYSYQIDPEGIEFEESHEDSEWVNDYFLAKLDAEGAEYHGDSAYEYWMGRQEVPIRRDGLQCKTGTPCGNRCIPRGHKCRVGSSGASGAALKQGGKGIGRVGKLAIGAAVAGGIVGASLHPSTQAAAANAGVVGRKIGEAVAGAAGKGVEKAKNLSNKVRDIANKAEARGREIMNRKSVAKQQAEAKAQRSGMKKTVQSMPTTSTSTSIPVDETVTKKKVSGKFNRKSKFTN